MLVLPIRNGGQKTVHASVPTGPHLVSLPQPGLEHVPRALWACSLNHWLTREVPELSS